MADGDQNQHQLDVLRDLLHVVEQAERHLHSEDINLLENRLSDYHTIIRTLLQRAMEQGVGGGLTVILGYIYVELLGHLGQYTELCDRNLLAEKDPDNIQDRYRFVRPRLDIDSDTLFNLHNIHHAWSAVADLTGVSYRTLLRRRHELALPVANTNGALIRRYLTMTYVVLLVIS